MAIRTTAQALAVIEKHGVVLQSARGALPNLAEAIAGEPIRGSWWGHPRGNAIYMILDQLTESPDVLAFKLVDGKVTLAHRRVWPALVRLAHELGRERLAAVGEEHLPSGAHRSIRIPFPKWVPDDVSRAAASMSQDDARAMLGDSFAAMAASPRRRKRSAR
ncbi:MAG: hypothetical protein ACREQF_13730 [Candidatus Binataceae bacterium]